MKVKLKDMLSVEQVIEIVKKNISELGYPSEPEGLYAPVRYILSLKGKKIRPVLTLLAYNLYSEQVENAYGLSNGWEIFHNFTLMHDDVMDHADVRRGEPTVHKVWNNSTAILSGDVMLILSYRCMESIGGPAGASIRRLFTDTAEGIMQGQQYDMDFESRFDVSEKEYMNMIKLKTAILLGACLKSGAILGGASEGDAEGLYDFGLNLGLAFQIMDDYLDVYGNADSFGKNIGGDIVCNKKNYFLVNALNSDDFHLRDSLLYWIRKENFDKEEKISFFTQVYTELGLRDSAREEMKKYYERALKAFSEVDLPCNKKQALYGLAEKLVNRTK